MYGNKTLPGVAISETYRDEGSIWRGYPEATWYKVVKVSGSEDETEKIPAGTIMKEDSSTGLYSPISADDIISDTANLPGVRLGIVSDYTAETNSSVQIGIQGQVDKAKLLVGETAFTKLTEAQQINLNTQLEAWGFMFVDVLEA